MCYGGLHGSVLNSAGEWIYLLNCCARCNSIAESCKALLADTVYMSWKERNTQRFQSMLNDFDGLVVEMLDYTTSRVICASLDLKPVCTSIVISMCKCKSLVKKN